MRGLDIPLPIYNTPICYVYLCIIINIIFIVIFIVTYNKGMGWEGGAERELEFPMFFCRGAAC